MGLNKKENRKLIFIPVLIILFFYCLIFIYSKAEAGLVNSAHDLSNETTSVSCLNCHWMHQKGTQNINGDIKGFRHSLVSQNTMWLCYACHSGRDPNSQAGLDSLISNGYMPANIVFKPEQNDKLFPGQDGINIYDIRKAYETAEKSPEGSFHLYYSMTKYPNVYQDTAMPNDKFTCFDCHNHGVENNGAPGGRLPKLLWSKGRYDSFVPFLGKDTDSILDMRNDSSQYYATEYFCLSCHAQNAFPYKWKSLDSLYWPPQIDDTAHIFSPVADTVIAFFSTKHTRLDRYGSTFYDTFSEPRNPFGTGKDISCLVCHNIHASTYPNLLRGNYDQNTMCQQCHSPVSSTPQNDTFVFTYRYETGGQYNYVTAGHSADKGYFTTYGHGRTDTSALGVAGAGLFCSSCHGVHGTGHSTMVKVVIRDPRPGSNTTYTLDTSEINALDSGKVSGFCAGACHNLKTPARNLFWWKSDILSTTAAMPSIYQGKEKFDSSAHKNAFNSARDKEVCAACHDSHGTPNPFLTWDSEETLCFRCHDSTMAGGAPDIKQYFVAAERGRSHHPVSDSAEQTSTRQIECTNCHNPHMATKANPVMNPFDWSTTGDTAGYVKFSTHKGRAGFCLTCHYEYYKNNVKTLGAYPPGVRIESAGGKLIGSEFNTTGHNKPSDTTVNYTVLIDCLNCHSPHGSTNPNNIRDAAYFDTTDGDTDYFDTVYYDSNTAFAAENTKQSRKFCYSVNGTSGCHTPQELTTQVVFPGGLGVDTSHHNSRKVPFGTLGNSYYIDEHNPYYDTTADMPPSGIVGCSVCHYKPHNPTPDYWYIQSSMGYAQYCLDCHSPVDSNGFNTTTGKFYGGAPSKYENPYAEFVSSSNTSRHLSSAGRNSITDVYCKDCHGEHTDHNIPEGNFVKRMNTFVSGYSYGYSTTITRNLNNYTTTIVQFITDTSYSTGIAANYLTSSSFCLSCHKGNAAFGKTAPDINITYNTSGHGRLTSAAGSLPVYCFDCHTKHASSNPSLLRTEIRDINFDSARDRNIRVEDLDTTYKKAADVREYGIQYICFACHTNAGDSISYDASNNNTVNAVNPNPGTALWLGKTIYESAGHGRTRIPGYRDTTYGTTATGLSCDWCHEPHGRGTDTNWAFNTSFNDDMLKIEGSVGLCLNCHDTTLTDTENNITISNIKGLFDSSVSRHNVYSTTASGARITCLNCHNPHTGNKTEPGVNPDNRTALSVGDDDFCRACHDGTPPAFSRGNPYPDVLFPATSVSGYDKSYYTASAHGQDQEKKVWCRTCHKPHGTNKPKLLREVYDFNQDNVLGGHFFDTVSIDTTTGTDISYDPDTGEYTTTYSSIVMDYRIEDVCFGCHRGHNGENDWPAAWTGVPDIRKFYYDTGGLIRTGTHHNVIIFRQVGPDAAFGTGDDTQLECANCHNQHVSTKSMPITDPDNPNDLLDPSVDSSLVKFCLRCHDNNPPANMGIKGLSNNNFQNIASIYGTPDVNGVYHFFGHFSKNDGTPVNCLGCHNTHGVNQVDSTSPFFQYNIAYYSDNTKQSRKLCYNPDGSNGCHSPQYLTTQVKFPDSLEVSSSTHARNVPYGPLGNSYYIDEHNPYYDTTNDTSASGIAGCSVCHYKPHTPTPDYWYSSSSAGAAQYCLDCHRSPAGGSDTANGKYYGGAPSKYETPYAEFTSPAYISRHFSGAGMDTATDYRCKVCHGEHTDHNIPEGTFVKRIDTSYSTLAITDYRASSSFCLSCHRNPAGSFGAGAAPDMEISYNTSGHGKLGEGSQPVYCFDCHSKHGSTNPSLLRTEIRDIINFESARNRNIRVEDLDSAYKKTADVKTDGIQYICFACHTNAGDSASYDTSSNDTVNAVNPNPGMALWLGKDAYESAGHGMTRIPGYRDTTYDTTAQGLSCDWCHEPHGKGTNLNWVYDSSINDDMLKIEGSVGLCLNCHDTTLTDIENNITISNIKVLFDSSVSKHDIYSQADSTGRITCLNCHNPHTGSKEYPVVVPDKRTTMNYGDDAFCLGCHRPSAQVPVFPASPMPSVVFPAAGGTGYDKSAYESSAHGVGMNEKAVWCRTCHKPHGTNKPDLLREVYDFNQDNELGEYSYESISNSIEYNTTNYKNEEVCFGCHRNHTGESDWNTAWADIPDVLRFYKVYTGAGNYSTVKTRSHHPIFLDEQRGPDGIWNTFDDRNIECSSCHNQHVSTKEKPITDPDTPSVLMSAYGTDSITFCLKCHDNSAPAGIKGLTDVNIRNIKNDYDPDGDGKYDTFTGHYRQRDGNPFECRLCHGMHGSDFSKQIQNATADVFDTFAMISSMRPVQLSSPFDTDSLAMSNTAELCLGCHSGKTQFYDREYDTWRYIPLPPPPQEIDTANVPVANFHPRLIDLSSTYISYADTGLLRKKVMSVYSTVFNINDTTIDMTGCKCHASHNPYKEPDALSQYSNCFNCHNKYSNLTDLETQFNSSIGNGSKHPAMANGDLFESSVRDGKPAIQYMECLKCHLLFETTAQGDTTYHRSGTGLMVFVDVNNSDTSFASRRHAVDPLDNTTKLDNSSKRNVTLFCLSCHNNPLADPDSTYSYNSTVTSPYRLTDTAYSTFGGNPVQLRGLDINDLALPKPSGGYYYPIDTASAHFDTSFGTAAVGGLSCIDCHDPHRSINKKLLQDFEEHVDRKDYNRDNNSTRVVDYNSVAGYELNEEKFCYFCHGSRNAVKGRFNSTGVNMNRLMTDIELKFSTANVRSRHKVDDTEQDADTSQIECTNCHNPHTARRTEIVLNAKTGKRATLTDKTEMNDFCLGCHDTGGPGETAAVPTSWDSGVQFPGFALNVNGKEWNGNSWNKYNKEAMKDGNKHYLNISCISCHDPHGSSNYRMLNEKIVSAFSPYQTTSIYGLKIMPQVKPDGRVRYEVYSTAYISAGVYVSATNYSINKFCFACHKSAMGFDPDYPPYETGTNSTYVYPGETAFNEWDFGTVNSANISLTQYDKVNGTVVANAYGKDKDCDYCHNPHGADTLRVHMVRDNVPQDLYRLSPTYGNKIDSTNWYNPADTLSAATGVDFCLSRGCHFSDQRIDLGSGTALAYDQFDLLDYPNSRALPYSYKRPETFKPDGIMYNNDTASWASRHPIVSPSANRPTGNTLLCVSCHTPHGSPGNTELAASYGSNYESTYPQDNASLRRAYYRGIYWWPVSIRKAESAQNNMIGLFNPTSPGRAKANASTSQIPSAGNDMCFECHRKEDIIGTANGINPNLTRFIGHEAVIGGSQIGKTRGTGLKGDTTNNDYHNFTCSTCHGPHASPDEKLLTMKCFYTKTTQAFDANSQYARDRYLATKAVSSQKYYSGENYGEGQSQDPGGPAGNNAGSCHLYGNDAGTLGWRTFTDTVKVDLARPSGGIDTLYTYFNTTRAYDTITTVSVINLPVKSNDLDVVLAWRSAYDSGGGNTTWVHHYNVYRGDTALSKQNKYYKAKSINTWSEWGYTLLNKIYDTGYASRPKTEYTTLYTIDPSIAHKIGRKYYYMVIPEDAQGLEAVAADCQDPYGFTYNSDYTPPRPVTTLTLTQELQENTNNIGMRVTWQDPGDNLATKNYSIYYAFVDSSRFDTAYSSLNSYLTTYLGNINDTNFSTASDMITAINFREYYGTVRYDANLFNSAAIATKKVYVVGIKASDAANNTCSSFGEIRYLRVADPVPFNITNLTARPNIVNNLSDTSNSNYNISLSWSVPWDNAQPDSSIPVYKVYRRLGQPIAQADIDRYNTSGDLFAVECITTLTGYGNYGYGSTITFTDNVAAGNITPGNVYYYAVTSIDKYATDQANREDTAYGYATDRVGWLYRERLAESTNTRLLDPISGLATNMTRSNTKISFNFNPAVYDTARFKQYNFYRRYNTSKVWALGTNFQTAWNTAGYDSLQTTFDTGNYYYAASVVYYSTYITIGGNTRWFDSLESPLNLTALINVQDLIPPATPVLTAALIPAQENGFDTLRLSWSQGTDTTNFKNYVITKIKHDTSEVDTVVYTTADTAQNSWTSVSPGPSWAWQTAAANQKYGAFAYSYKITANDSAYNYSEAVTSLVTRPPTYNVTPLAQALNTITGIRLSWNDMLQYSEIKNYGAGGYKIYGKRTYSPTETMGRIFQPGTFNLDDGVYKLGEVTADTSLEQSYSRINQAIYGTATASSSLIDNPPTKIYDTVLSSFWRSNDTSSSTYVELDLGSDKVIEKIVYNNQGDLVYSNSRTQGYTILAASESQYAGSLWETVADYPRTTPRQKLVFQRERTGIRYIRATNFSRSGPDTTLAPATVYEIEAYYPYDTTRTSFDHLVTNPNLAVEAGRWYTYGVTLEDKNGIKSRSMLLLNSISVLDIEAPAQITITANLFPAQENGYNSVSLSWSGGTDSNFKNYVITRIKHDTTELADTVFATLTDSSQTIWTSAAPAPSTLWQTANVKYGAFKYSYKIRAYDTANNYSEASTTLVTRPPSTNMNFLAQSLTAVTGVRLSWNNMLTYSETTNYGVGGYKVYAKKANSQSDTLGRIFQPGTFNLETGVYKLGEVAANTTGLPSYATTNQAVYATATASSSYSGSYLPINIKDGSLNTVWRSLNSESAGAWIQLAFSSDVVIEKIVYNNYGNGSLFDTAQGYIILASSAAQNSTDTWETVADKPGTTQRGTFVYQRAPRTPVKYIRATNFSRSGSVDTTVSPAAVFELEAYYPNDTTTTTFIHLGTNGYLAAEAGKWYAYGITLEDKAGNKGAPVFSTTCISILDIDPPQPVIDLVAYGLEGSSNIYLKWSQPNDNMGVKEYEIWRRKSNSEIFPYQSSGAENFKVGSTYTVNTVNVPQFGGTYFYAIAALDSAGNKSKFSGTNYSAGATVGFTRDSIPPEPITLESNKFDTATRNRIQLTWSLPSNPALDKKDYDTLFNVDTALYTQRITKYFVYRENKSLDSTPFANKFSSISGRDTFDNGTGGVANGWSAGVWGGSGAPVVLPNIVYDSTRGSNVQQLNIYNYSGDPKEKIPANSKYIKTAAYIKTTGYQFDSSQALNDTLAVRYLFGLWLKAEGAVSGQPYRGTVYLDAATRLNTGNESTFISLGRREVINPSQNWTYYLVNLRMPADTTYSSTENGVMVWAANNGNIWLDDAELVKLGKPLQGVGVDTSILYYDTNIAVNNTYYYAVTALDISSDPTGGNEGRFANIGEASSDIRVPAFDVDMFTSPDVDPDPADPNDGNRTGTTPSIRFIPGMDTVTVRNDVNHENHLYDSDNIFRNGDIITLQFKMLVPPVNPPVPKLDILPDGMIIGDFYNMDSTHFAGAEARFGYGSGIYGYRYYFNPYATIENYADDTPYNTSMHKYESLYQVKVFVRDGNGNGPSLLGREIYADSDTTDNNPDTTYQAILDNTAPSYPE